VTVISPAATEIRTHIRWMIRRDMPAILTKCCRDGRRVRGSSGWLHDIRIA
jgi:hypothetical protein